MRIVIALFSGCPIILLFIGASIYVHSQSATGLDNNASNPKTKRRIVLPPEKSAPVRIPRFDRPPVIDGKIDDDVWQHAAKLKNFYQTSPGDNIAPSAQTEVLLGYDSKFFYAAFHAFDDPSKIRANLVKRDDIFNDDYVGMLLDTFNDHRKAYELDFNPLGIQEDGLWQDPSLTRISIRIS